MSGKFEYVLCDIVIGAPRLRSVTPPRVSIVKREKTTSSGMRRTALGSATISGKLGTPQQVLMMAE